MKTLKRMLSGALRSYVNKCSNDFLFAILTFPIAFVTAIAIAELIFLSVAIFLLIVTMLISWIYAVFNLDVISTVGTTVSGLIVLIAVLTMNHLSKIRMRQLTTGKR